jgi:hypothetical protein
MMGPPGFPAALSFVGFVAVESGIVLFVAFESAVAQVGVVL